MSRRFAVACLLGAVALPAAAQDVQRCEGTDGKVTYSNGPCPAGTAAVRTLPAAGAPSANEQKAAQQRSRQDLREAEALERSRKADEQRAAREHEQAQAAEKKRQSQCRKLETRVRHAQEDLAAAAPAKRTEAQRRLKRAEEAHAAECPAPR